jgi:hypothetical protein
LGRREEAAATCSLLSAYGGLDGVLKDLVKIRA